MCVAFLLREEWMQRNNKARAMSPCSAQQSLGCANLQLWLSRVKHGMYMMWNVHYSAPQWGCSEKPFWQCHTNSSEDMYIQTFWGKSLSFYRASKWPNEKTFSVASLHTTDESVCCRFFPSKFFSRTRFSSLAQLVVTILSTCFAPKIGVFFQSQGYKYFWSKYYSSSDVPFT